VPGYGHAAGTEGLSHNSAGETSCATQSIATYLPGQSFGGHNNGRDE
jgi:hypothetical protein